MAHALIWSHLVPRTYLRTNGELHFIPLSYASGTLRVSPLLKPLRSSSGHLAADCEMCRAVETPCRQGRGAWMRTAINSTQSLYISAQCDRYMDTFASKAQRTSAWKRCNREWMYYYRKVVTRVAFYGAYLAPLCQRQQSE